MCVCVFARACVSPVLVLMLMLVLVLACDEPVELFKRVVVIHVIIFLALVRVSTKKKRE